MMRVLIQNWWLLGLRGFLALVFAALAFSMRGLLNAYFINAIAFVTLVVIFGLLALAAGVCTMAAGARGAGGQDKSWWLIGDGVVLSIAGLLAVMASKLSLSTVGHVVAVSALVIGICELFLAGRIRRHVPDEWFLVLSGAGSLCFGSYLVFMWTHEASVIGKWVGIYAFFSGMVTLGLALRLRALRGSIHKLAATTGRTR
jgi:uncharacterized membrane protein HdeD (DUF308 family)